MMLKIKKIHINLILPFSTFQGHIWHGGTLIHFSEAIISFEECAISFGPLIICIVLHAKLAESDRDCKWTCIL